MNTLEAIQTRRNIKAFKPEAVDKERIIGWLEAASFAPNHRMTEPWEIRFVGPETRALLNHKTDFGGAPAVIVITSKGGASEPEREENLMAAACFAQNFLLAAHAEGAGAFWSSLAASPRSRDILGIPEGHDVVGIFGVGIPAEIPPLKDRTPIALKIAAELA
ncbi:nitroreductase family protein [Cohnella lubricantis]|uniref:Nitroreductase family protein n=1 Tax=Cohnella lubricantis TaxID=2163172 RepID=A0A841TA68_9BACL|nr:nitroreductase family protein [Cohnella lubricantis]MBB6676956.1 nitroreductase family protein [Cohnella lubricantis]MBP2118361.1 nitroreductase [Cohnella lubricantis]